MGAQAESLSFERDGPATAERVQDGRQVLSQEGVHRLRRSEHVLEVVGRGTRDHLLVRLPTAVGDHLGGTGPCYLGTGAIDDVAVVRVLPLDQLLDQVEQLGPLARGQQFVAGEGGIIARVRDKLSKQDGPTGCQRPPCPPQMQRGWMPVPNRLLPRRLTIDSGQR